MCLAKGKLSPCSEGILPLFSTAGKMPAGRKDGTASPQTTIRMRLPPNRIDVKRVAASKPQALGMVANEGFVTEKSQYVNSTKEVEP